MMKPVTLLKSAAVLALATHAAVATAKNWGEWAPPATIESLPGSSSLLNTSSVDGCGSLSPDGLDYYFASNRGQGSNIDLFVAHREDVASGFGPPENLGPAINGPALEICPTMTPGGRLYFTSMRDDGAGDLYVSKRGRNGWSAPQRLGPAINAVGSLDESPTFYEDDQGRQVMLFNSNRSGQHRIYASIDFGPAQLVVGGVNSSANDRRPGVSKDGLEMFWDSDRFGTLGQADIWTARRGSASEPWGPAEHVAVLSSTADDRRPTPSRDGGTIVIARTPGPEGGIDELISTRSKLTGEK